MRTSFKTKFAALIFLISFNSFANNSLVLDTLFQQGVKFVSADYLSGPSASAFATYRMMMSTDSEHPKSKAFASLLERAVKNKVATLKRSDQLQAEKLKLDYLSLQYEVGVSPSSWLLGEEAFSTSVPQKGNSQPVATQPKQTIAAEQLTSRQETTLYKNAKVYLTRKQLFTPERKNAMHALLRILRSNPRNEKAISLYFKVIERSYGVVEELIEDKQFAQAESFVRAGLAMMPDNYELQGLYAVAQGHKALQAHAEGLHDPDQYVAKLKSGVKNRLLTNGRTYLQRKEFFSPEGANAYDKFSRVLQSEPNNQKAMNYIHRLGSGVTEFAQELANEGELRQAISLLEQGLSEIPSMTAWERLKQELEAQLNIRETRLRYAQQNYSTTLSKKSIRALLANTKVYIRDGSFFGSGRDNANAALLRVMATAPDHDKVPGLQKQLIEEVVEAVIELAGTGDLRRAKLIVNTALEHFPEHAELKRLQGHINSLS